MTGVMYIEMQLLLQYLFNQMEAWVHYVALSTYLADLK